MSRAIKPHTTIFLTLLSITTVVWVLRGLGILTFIPGFVIWLLIFLSIGSGVISSVQRTQR